MYTKGYEYEANGATDVQVAPPSQDRIKTPPDDADPASTAQVPLAPHAAAVKTAWE